MTRSQFAIYWMGYLFEHGGYTKITIELRKLELFND